MDFIDDRWSFFYRLKYIMPVERPFYPIPPLQPFPIYHYSLYFMEILRPAHLYIISILSLSSDL
jgi:hypothetical protein